MADAIDCVRDMGEYRLKITVETMSGSADAHGLVDPTDNNNWSSHATAWAKVMTKGGREYNFRNEIQSEVSHIFVCPYDSTLASATPAMRISWNSNNYEILSVVDVEEAKTEIELHTKKTAS